MNTNNNLHAQAQQKKALEAATDWVIAIEEQPECVNSAAFKEWFNLSPAHAIAFHHASRIWGLAVKLPPLDEPAGGDVLPFSTKSDSNASAGWKVRVDQLAALAASMIIVVSLYLSGANSPDSQNLTAQLQTETGEIDQFTLADKSILYLDANTVAQVTINDKVREVELVSGRVFSEVAHEQYRRFRVAINDTTAFTALGTAYSVEKRQRGWVLEVYEGTVGISSTLVRHMPVTAGWGLRYEANELSRYRLAPSLADKQPDWSRKQVTFTNTRLEDAVLKLNKYATKSIVVKDILADFPVSGVFALDNPEAFVKSVQHLTKAKVIESDTSFTLVSPETRL